MKKGLSLKWRISLWFTLILILITGAFFSVAISSYRVLHKEELRDELKNAVEEEAENLKEDKDYRERVLKGEAEDSSFIREDVQLMVYDEDGERIDGIFLHEEPDHHSFEEGGPIHRGEIGDELYYYFDKRVVIRHDKDLYVRGVIKAEQSIGKILKENMLLALMVPALILVAFFGGSLLTEHFLRPIRKIDETTESIRRSGDLTKRIPYEDKGDELSALSSHINGMFDTLQNNFEAEKQFTSSASHELRTPVSVILAQCEYALENADTKEELKESVASIQKQGYKMSRMIETLLMFTRMDQGTEKYPLERVNVTEVVNSACEDFKIIAGKNIRVEYEPAENVYMQANRELFTLMVNNLIRNAIRYGREDGHVYVELGERIAPDLEEEKSPGEGKTQVEHFSAITLEIKDDGLGIDPQDLPHIFEMFYRGDKSRNTKGLGLGLSLVQRIVTFHHGKITVKSTPGEGSTFTCVFYEKR